MVGARVSAEAKFFVMGAATIGELLLNAVKTVDLFARGALLMSGPSVSVGRAAGGSGASAPYKDHKFSESNNASVHTLSVCRLLLMELRNFNIDSNHAAIATGPDDSPSLHAVQISSRAIRVRITYISSLSIYD